MKSNIKGNCCRYREILTHSQ